MHIDCNHLKAATDSESLKIFQFTLKMGFATNKNYLFLTFLLLWWICPAHVLFSWVVGGVIITHATSTPIIRGYRIGLVARRCGAPALGFQYILYW